MRNEIGRNIQRYRLLAGMTQEELAEQTSLSPAHISNIERGKKNIKITTLYTLAHALRVTPAALLCAEDDTPSRVQDAVLRDLTLACRLVVEKYRWESA